MNESSCDIARASQNSSAPRSRWTSCVLSRSSLVRVLSRSALVDRSASPRRVIQVVWLYFVVTM